MSPLCLSAAAPMVRECVGSRFPPSITRHSLMTTLWIGKAMRLQGLPRFGPVACQIDCSLLNRDHQTSKLAANIFFRILLCLSFGLLVMADTKYQHSWNNFFLCNLLSPSKLEHKGFCTKKWSARNVCPTRKNVLFKAPPPARMLSWCQCIGIPEPRTKVNLNFGLLVNRLIQHSQLPRQCTVHSHVGSEVSLQ